MVRAINYWDVRDIERFEYNNSVVCFEIHSRNDKFDVTGKFYVDLFTDNANAAIYITEIDSGEYKSNAYPVDPIFIDYIYDNDIASINRLFASLIDIACNNNFACCFNGD